MRYFTFLFKLHLLKFTLGTILNECVADLDQPISVLKLCGANFTL